MNINLILTGKISALISFIIGTILLSFYLYFDKSEAVVNIGLYYVIIAFLFNTFLLLILVINGFAYGNSQLESLKTCGLILLNIPITILYLYLILTVSPF